MLQISGSGGLRRGARLARALLQSTHNEMPAPRSLGSGLAMPERAMRMLFHSFSHPRPTDVVDILVVTMLVYTAIVWIRRTEAVLVARGIFILALLYVVARTLGLQLTAWIFQGFFAIFFVIVVIIFQEEVRQLLERVAVWRPRERRTLGEAWRSTDILVRCLTDLSDDHVGALVVVPGRQPIGRHVRGGIELDGKLSIPLLKSLFDPHSPGHDGAVVVEDGRIRRFAAQLPLSRDFQQLTGRGTRHAAALGLAELTDAVCLVVSEERGGISVARDGRLRPLRDSQELVRVLEGVPDRAASGETRRVWRHVVRENWVLKVVALGIVVTLWSLFVPGARSAQMIFNLPLTVTNLQPGYVLEDVEPRQLEVTFGGAAGAFYLLDARRLGVTVDAGAARPGRRTVSVSEKNLTYPRTVVVEEMRPTEVTIVVRRAPEAAS